MQINEERPQEQLNQPEHAPQQQSMLPVELSLFERLDKGFAMYDIAETRLTVTGPKISEKYSGNSTVIAQHGWIDVDNVIKYLVYSYIFKIVVGIFMLLNVFLLWQAWQYTCFVMAAFSLGYGGWNFILWNSFRRVESRSYTEMFFFESIIGINYTLFFIFLALFFMKGSWLFIFPSLFLVCLIIYMIYSIRTANSYFVHRASSLIEAVQLFGITMKLLKLTSLSWNYSLSFFMLSSLYYSVMGFVFLMLFCNMRYRGLAFHDFLPGMRFYGFHLMGTGLVYQQLIGALPLLYTYPERLADNLKSSEQTSVMDGKAQTVQACVLLAVINLGLLLTLIYQRNSVK
jgi:hypothetical protein